MGEYDPGQRWEQRGERSFNSFTRHPWLWIVGIILAIVLLTAGVGLASNWWGAQRAKLTVGNRVTQSVYGTGNALHNISYFHSQCNTIGADNQQVTNDWNALVQDKQQLASATDPIAQQQQGQVVAQDRVTWLGVKNQLTNDVADYNARSADQTASPFKGTNLPTRISLNPTSGELVGTVDCH